MKFTKRVLCRGASVLALMSLAASANAQTFTFTSTDTPIAIPDNNATGITSTIAVPNLGIITDANVAVDINHTFVGDLIVTVASSNGTAVRLIDRPGVPPDFFGNGDSLSGTYVFDDAAVMVIPETASGGLVAPGKYLVDQTTGEALGQFNGETTSGNWALTVSDNAGFDFGTLNFWQLILQVAAVDPAFVAPALPTVLNTNTAKFFGSMDARISAFVGADGSATTTNDGESKEHALGLGNPFVDAHWGTWLRGAASNSQADGAVQNLFTPGTSDFDSDFNYVQGGLSFLLTQAVGVRYVGSIFAHFGNADTSYDDANGLLRGTTSTDSYGGGASITGYFDNGFFGDITGMVTWHDIGLTTVSGAAGSTDAMSYGVSLEAGYRYEIDAITVIPQAQLIYQRTSIDDFNDSLATTYAFQDETYFNGRIGVGFEKTQQLQSTDATLKFKAGINLDRDFSNDGSSIVNGTRLGFDSEATGVLVSAGVDFLPNTSNFRAGINGELREPFGDGGVQSYSVGAFASLKF